MRKLTACAGVAAAALGCLLTGCQAPSQQAAGPPSTPSVAGSASAPTPTALAPATAPESPLPTSAPTPSSTSASKWTPPATAPESYFDYSYHGGNLDQEHVCAKYSYGSVIYANYGPTSPALTASAHRICIFTPISEASNATDSLLVYLDGKDASGFDQDVAQNDVAAGATAKSVSGFGDRAVLSESDMDVPQIKPGAVLHTARLVAVFNGQYYSVTATNLGDQWGRPSLSDLEKIILAVKQSAG